MDGLATDSTRNQDNDLSTGRRKSNCTHIRMYSGMRMCVCVCVFCLCVVVYATYVLLKISNFLCRISNCNNCSYFLDSSHAPALYFEFY